MEKNTYQRKNKHDYQNLLLSIEWIFLDVVDPIINVPGCARLNTEH